MGNVFKMAFVSVKKDALVSTAQQVSFHLIEHSVHFCIFVFIQYKIYKRNKKLSVLLPIPVFYCASNFTKLTMMVISLILHAQY